MTNWTDFKRDDAIVIFLDNLMNKAMAAMADL